MARTESPRQKLLRLTESGELRQNLEGRPGWDTDVVDLLVTVTLRYCEPRREPRWKRLRRTR